MSLALLTSSSRITSSLGGGSTPLRRPSHEPAKCPPKNDARNWLPSLSCEAMDTTSVSRMFSTTWSSMRLPRSNKRSILPPKVDGKHQRKPIHCLYSSSSLIPLKPRWPRLRPSFSAICSSIRSKMDANDIPVLTLFSYSYLFDVLHGSVVVDLNQSLLNGAWAPMVVGQ